MLLVKSCSFTEGWTSKFNLVSEEPLRKTCFFRLIVQNQENQEEAQLAAIFLGDCEIVKSKQFSGNDKCMNHWNWTHLDWSEMIVSSSFQEKAEKALHLLISK